MASTEIMGWLREGDPSVSWQVERDLLGYPPQVYQRTRLRISQEGWGKKLLSCQDPSGTWGGGFYSPKWISTHYTLLSLASLGLDQQDQQARRGCLLYLDRTFFDPDGGINIHATYPQSETCVSGMALNFLSYFQLADQRLERIADHLLGQQMPDGGWNCESFKGASHSSFHTTLSVLEGLWRYQQHIKADPRISTARGLALEFLLQHKLYRSHRSGEIVDLRMTRFPFPSRWFYDVLRALDYMQASGAVYDDRFEDALQLLLSKQNKQGTWQAYRGPSGRTFFDFEPAGQPSRINTLRALRVLKWWHSLQGTAPGPEIDE